MIGLGAKKASGDFSQMSNLRKGLRLIAEEHFVIRARADP